MLEDRDRASTSSSASAPACWSSATVELLREPGLAGSPGPRERWSTRASSSASTATGHRIALTELTGRVDLHLRPAGGREGPHRGPAGRRRRRSCSRSRTCRLDGVRRRDDAGDPLPPRRRRARAAVRPDRRAATASTASAATSIPLGVPCGSSSTTIPFAWLGILAAVAAVHRGADLRAARARVRAAQPALAGDQPALPPGRPDEDRRRLGRTIASGTSWRRGWRSRAGTLADGPVLEKGIAPMRSFVAEPMQSRPALPRRRRRAHRAGHRRQGPEPRRQRRARAGRGDRRVVRDRRRIARWTATRTGCLRRVWRAQHFSQWMSAMLHRLPGTTIRSATGSSWRQLDYVTSSTAAATRPRRELRRPAVRLNRRERHALPPPTWRAEVVGSLLRPDYLKDAFDRCRSRRDRRGGARRRAGPSRRSRPSRCRSRPASTC